MSRLPALLLCFIAPGLVAADDWPQWRGPNRDGKSAEKGLLKSWPEGGPKLLWTARDLGKGYSSYSVIDGKLYSMGADVESNEQFVFCLDATSGKELWRESLGTKFSHGYQGTRSTPTIDGKRLYALGGDGELVCMDVENGSKIWSVNMKSDLNGRMMSGWGYSESVLVDGDRLICTPGGSDGTLAALDKNTGKVVWRSDVTDRAAYASIRTHELGGVKQYVTMTSDGVIGVKAEDGKLLWKNSSLKLRTAVIPTPVMDEELIFATSGYGSGCVLVKVTEEGGEFSQQEMYTSPTMSNHHGGVILLDGHVYGHTNRGEGWVCMELASGEIKWESGREFGKGSITYADGHFYCYDERTGNLAMIEATPKAWTEVGRLKLPEEAKIQDRGKFWVHPVVANGKLYVRDKDLLFCFDVKAK